MADKAPQRPARSPDPAVQARQRREAADERRARQTAAVVNAQADLKREAAERRAAKKDS